VASVLLAAMVTAREQRAMRHQRVAVVPDDEHLRTVGCPQNLRGQDVLGAPLGDQAAVKAQQPRQMRRYRIQVMGREENCQPLLAEFLKEMQEGMQGFQIDSDRGFVEQEELRVSRVSSWGT
jgi:hypothetical protein